jgi:hypothetical protein
VSDRTARHDTHGARETLVRVGGAVALTVLLAVTTAAAAPVAVPPSGPGEVGARPGPTATGGEPEAGAVRVAAGEATPSPSPPAAPVPPARPPRAKLPVIDYGPAPRGFPADPTPQSTAPLTEGLHPTARVPAYDAPGGRARALLPPDILGVTLIVPIVERRSGWTAVMLPSANRRIAWLATGAWIEVPLNDQLVVTRRNHRLTWYRDGVRKRSWKVSLGAAATPTPLGRTFILGRSRLRGEVYANTDVFALGAVPDNPNAVPVGLRGAHIGIHTWYHDGELGRNTTDGCVRLTKRGQRELLAKVPPGTPVVVIDRPL